MSHQKAHTNSNLKYCVTLYVTDLATEGFSFKSIVSSCVSKYLIGNLLKIYEIPFVRYGPKG